MSVKAERSRLDWLSACLSTQKQRVASLLSRVADLGFVQAMRPKLFAKFMHMMGQVAAMRDEEMRLISEIESIENRHRFDRKHGRLKHIDRKALNDNAPLLDCEREEYESDYIEDRDLGDENIREATTGAYLSILGPPAPAPRRNRLLWIVTLWVLMSGGQGNNKNQRLNPD